MPEMSDLCYLRKPRMKTFSFSQRILGEVLKDYVYALTEWRRLGRDDRLSAQDARDKATSTIEEMISIAQEVKYLKRNYMMLETCLIQQLLFSVNLQWYFG